MFLINAINTSITMAFAEAANPTAINLAKVAKNSSNLVVWYMKPMRKSLKMMMEKTAPSTAASCNKTVI